MTLSDSNPKSTMKNTLRYSALATVAVTLTFCFFVGCESSQNAAPRVPQNAAHVANFERPLVCFGLYIKPNTATIKVDQQITLRSEYKSPLMRNCSIAAVSAVWRSTGGSLQVIHNGKQAIFSSSAVGTYTVSAYWHGLKANATIMVTP